MVPGLAPRRAALTILKHTRRGLSFEVALERGMARLAAEADRRLAHELAAGVLRQRKVLDQRLAPLVPRGWERVSPALQDLLRLGAYQLTFLNRIPSHAAVDTSAALAKLMGGARAAGFVNAVMRRLARDETSPATPPAVSGEDEAAILAAAYSHPQWLVRRWIDSFGIKDTERLLRWNNTRPRLVVQPARAESDALAQRWRAEGLQVKTAPEGAGLVVNRSKPEALSGYQEGDFIVQDPAQALLAKYVDPPAGATVYDACAAPGGKSITLGRRAASIVAGEVSGRRARRLTQNLKRAGSGHEHVVVADARHPPVRSADVVLVDAPCLGTGTFARHPDARWRVTPEALANLQQLQGQLLEKAASVVKPGGLLVYSTCSLEPEENVAQVNRFLAAHPEYCREPGTAVSSSLLTGEGDLSILPHQHGMDGAYAARLRRRA
jgi:16S rRNA (cytosine967-C5)-methyltransferase